MPNLKKILPVILMMIPSLAPAETLDEEFETWKPSQTGPSVTHPPAHLAQATVDGQTESNAVSTRLELTESSAEAAVEQATEDFIIHFGAGASWIVPLRLADKATDDKVLSVFSASWAPFGLVGEVGIDLAIARDSSFLVSPNLKFFFVKHHAFSCYLEGSLAIHSHLAGTDFGGGAGLGMIFGLVDHLALEFRASMVLLDLSEEVAGQMFDAEEDPTKQVSNLVIGPSVGARLVARF